MREPYLQTDHMTVGYGGRPLVEDICLRLQRGEIMTLIGPNGAGKSTILKSIIRQLQLIRGTVYLDGHPMDRMTAQDVARRLSILMTEHVRPELMTLSHIG